MDAANDEYRRRARRLRWRLRDRPADMQRELGKLAGAGPVPSPAFLSSDAMPGRRGRRPYYVASPESSSGTRNLHPTGPAADIVFLDEVRQCLDGKILRYSCREELLRRAAELGIGRFDANLLIASAQHQASAGTTTLLPEQRRGLSMMALTSAALVLQSVVLLGLWLILR